MRVCRYIILALAGVLLGVALVFLDRSTALAAGNSGTGVGLPGHQASVQAGSPPASPGGQVSASTSTSGGTARVSANSPAASVTVSTSVPQAPVPAASAPPSVSGSPAPAVQVQVSTSPAAVQGQAAAPPVQVQVSAAPVQAQATAGSVRLPPVSAPAPQKPGPNDAPSKGEAPAVTGPAAGPVRIIHQTSGSPVRRWSAGAVVGQHSGSPGETHAQVAAAGDQSASTDGPTAAQPAPSAAGIGDSTRVMRHKQVAEARGPLSAASTARVTGPLPEAGPRDRHAALGHHRSRTVAPRSTHPAGDHESLSNRPVISSAPAQTLLSARRAAPAGRLPRAARETPSLLDTLAALAGSAAGAAATLTRVPAAMSADLLAAGTLLLLAWQAVRPRPLLLPAGVSVGTPAPPG